MSVLPARTEPHPPPRWRRWARLVRVDRAPLRHREYRLLFFSGGVSLFGSMMTQTVAVPFQVYHLTHSSLAVGLLGLVEVGPILLLAFLGGALADAHDRRRLVQLTELALAAISLVLLLNTLLPQPQLWLLYAAVAAMAGLDALQRPSLDALLPRLVARDELPAAGALGSLRSTVAMVAGPALAGLLIATLGLTETYGIDLITFLLSLAALFRMRAVPPPAGAARPSLRRVLEGIAYARSRPDLLGTYLVDMVAMFFGMPSALFPALAVRFGGAGALGLLLAAPAAGAFLVGATSGWVSHVHRHGLAIILAAAAWGVALIGFGLSPTLPLALLFLLLAGGADMVSGIFRSTIWNQTIPDSLRGRLAGLELISFSSGPALGNVEAGAVAALFGLRISIVSGGVLCVAGTLLLAALLPAFRQYDARRSTAG